MLYLRYQTSEPDVNNRPPAVLSMSVISELLKVPQQTLTWMHRKYFQPAASDQDEIQISNTPKYNVQATGSKQVTMKNITDEEYDFIIDQDNQRCWANLSIEKRCVMFHRRFMDRRIKKQVMRKVMMQAGIKKKKIEVNVVPARKEERRSEFELNTVNTD